MRILQNQAVFTPPYSSHVKYLYDGIPIFVAVFIKKLPYKELFEGIIQFVLSWRYDICVTVGHRQAIMFGVLNRIFWGKKSQVVKELYIDETALSSKFITWIYRWAFRNLSLVITNSSGEIPYMMSWLRLPMDRFKFIPWPSNVPVQGNPREENEKMLFDVFAAGRSFRDWETFFSALKETNLRCCVVATKKDIRNKGIPNEVAIYYDISHNEYLELLGKAKIVVIPLKKTFRSIGQAAILEAMAFGKAVITAELTGTMDYVQTGINGLFYEPGDTKSLRDAILRLLKDNDLQRKLGEAAKQSIENYFNKNSYSERMLETMLEVCLHG